MKDDFDIVPIPDEMSAEDAGAMAIAPPEVSTELLQNNTNDDFDVVAMPDGNPSTAQELRELPMQPSHEPYTGDHYLSRFKAGIKSAFDRVLGFEDDPTPGHDISPVEGGGEQSTPDNSTPKTPEQEEPKPKNMQEAITAALKKDLAKTVEEMQKPLGKQVAETLLAETIDDKKWAYMQQGAWQKSLTGSVMRKTFEVELDQELENTMNFREKVAREAMAMGPDVWLFALGGAIPKAGNILLSKAAPYASRSLPLLTPAAAKMEGVVQTASSFGFFEGVRRMYMNKLLAEGEGDGKASFTDLIGGTFMDSMKGFAVGLTLGQGSVLRSSLYKSVENPLVGSAKVAAELVPEASAVAMLQSQLNNPGVLPDVEDFALSASLILGFEGFGQVRRLASDIRKGKVIKPDTSTDFGVSTKVNAGFMGDQAPHAVEFTRRVYERYATHPETLAMDLLSDTSVMEDAANVLRPDTVRKYEVDGGMKVDPPKIMQEVRDVFDEARREMLPEDRLKASVKSRAKSVGGDHTNFDPAHAMRVGTFALDLGQSLGFSPQEMAQLAKAAEYHDIGKVLIPKDILEKNGKLTPEEHDIVKGHTADVEKLLKGKSSTVVQAVKQHHEGWDGSGYPENLNGQSISKLARAISVADVYDALTSKRAYKEAMPHEEAVGILQGMAGKSLDPDMVNKFIEVQTQKRAEAAELQANQDATSDLVQPNNQGPVGTAITPATSQPIYPRLGEFHPMQYYANDALTRMALPDGRVIVLPTNRQRALSLSEHGLINSPQAVVLGKQIIEGMQMVATSDKSDLNMVGNWGYFVPPELGRKWEVDKLTKQVKTANRALRKAIRRNDRTGEEAQRRILNALSDRLMEEQNRPLRGSDARIAINKVLGAATPGAQLATVLHEVGHSLSYAVDQWGQHGISPGVHNNLFKALSGYPHLIEDAMSFAQREGLDPNQLFMENLMLSRLWRPIPDQAFHNPKVAAYRMSGAELTADLVSVMLHRPDIVQQYAPTIHKAMELFYRARPEAKQRVDDMYAMINNGNDVDTLIDTYKSAFAKEEDLLRNQKDAGVEQVRKRLNAGASRIEANLVDKFQPLWNAAPRIDIGVHNSVQRLQFSGSVKKGYISQLNQYALKPMKKLGFTNKELGVLFMTRRIANDTGRENIFNVSMTDPIEAQKVFDKLASTKKAELEGLMDDFHEVRKRTILKEYRDSGMYGDDFLDTAGDNNFYARFSDMGHFEKWLEEGRYTISKRRGSEVLTTQEAHAQKQTGSIGDIRNALSATIEMDLHMYDVLLREGALKKLIDSSVDSDMLPFIPAEAFDTVAEKTPRLLKGYAKAEFTQVTLPTRVLDQKTGKYITVRKAWMGPREVIEPFVNQPTEVQTFLGNLASQDFSGLAKRFVTTKEGDRRQLALQVAGKAVQNTNALYRFLTITTNGSFMLANFFSYDPIRSMTNMPSGGKLGMFKYYPDAAYDLIKYGFQGAMSDSVMSALNRGILSTRQRFVEEFSNSELTDRLLYEYGDSGFMGKVDWKAKNLASNLITGTSELFRVILDVMDGTSKLAAQKWFEAEEAAGRSNFTPEQRDVILREQVGSPAYAIRGNSTALGNMAMPFLNSIVQATRGDWRAFKRDPKSWALTAGAMMVPTIIQALAKNGAFDGGSDEDKDGVSALINDAMPVPDNQWRISDVYKTKSSRLLNSNWFIPTGIDTETGNGSGVAWPIAQNPALRFLHVTTTAFIDALFIAAKENPGDKDVKGMIDELTGIASGAMRSWADVGGSLSPSSSPAFSVPVDAYRLMRYGNTYSDFLGRMKYTENKSPEDRLEAVLETAIDNLGFSKNTKNIDKWFGAIGRIFNPGPEDDDKSLSERVMEGGVLAPIFGDGHNRFIKSDNTGLMERNMKEQEQKLYDAQFRRKLVDDALESGDYSDLFAHPERGEITSRLIKSRQKKHGVEMIDNMYLQNIVKYGTNASVDNAIQASGYSEKAREAVAFIKAENRKGKK